MAEVETTRDVLATFPVWVQFAANLGVFVVAVAAASFGFVRKRLPTLAHEAVETVDHGSLLTDINDSLKSIALSAQAMATSRVRHDEEERIEREVMRRVTEERKSTVREERDNAARL